MLETKQPRAPITSGVNNSMNPRSEDWSVSIRPRMASALITMNTAAIIISSAPRAQLSMYIALPRRCLNSLRSRAAGMLAALTCFST